MSPPKPSLPFWRPSSLHGQKRRFIIAGFVNVVLTNSILQILLVSSFLSIGLATFLSQLFNTILGFVVYGKVAFNVNTIASPVFALRYSFLMVIMWTSNWFGIELLRTFGYTAHISGLIMVPPLAAISYITQKQWVFLK